MPEIVAPRDAVLIVDGTFLQRPELAGGWDLTIYINASDCVAEKRGIERDKALLGGADAAARLYAERYRAAFGIYEAASKPELLADAIIENDDLERPQLKIKPGGRLDNP